MTCAYNRITEHYDFSFIGRNKSLLLYSQPCLKGHLYLANHCLLEAVSFPPLMNIILFRILYIMATFSGSPECMSFIFPVLASCTQLCLCVLVYTATNVPKWQIGEMWMIEELSQILDNWRINAERSRLTN